MAVTLIERHDSRQFSISATRGDGAYRYTAYVTGEANPEDAVYDAVLAAAPFYFNGLARQQIQADPLGGGWYDVTVPYAWEITGTAAQDPTQTPDPLTGGPGGGPPSGTPSGPATEDTPNGPNISGEITGRPPRYTQSKAVVASGRFGAVLVPDHGRLIHYNRTTGEVEGVELVDPEHTFTLDHPFDYITPKLLKRWTAARWKTNNATWRHNPAGSVVFLGVSYSYGPDSRPRASLRFGSFTPRTIAAGELRDEGGVKLPSAPVAMKGWEYLEIQYRDEKDAATGFVVGKPDYFFVHRLLDEMNFADLGVGT